MNGFFMKFCAGVGVAKDQRLDFGGNLMTTSPSLLQFFTPVVHFKWASNVFPIVRQMAAQ